MKKIKLPNGELSPHIFFTSIQIDKNTHVPICQMISTVQNTNAITY